jgi:hypothetical protein
MAGIEDDIKKLLDENSSRVEQSTTSIGMIVKQFTDALGSNFNVKSITNEIINMDNRATQVIKTFGVGRESILSIKQSFADAYESVALIGGQWENIIKIQQDVSTTLNRNIVLTSDSYKDLFATTQVTGTELGSLVGNFKNVGYSTYQISDQMLKVVREANSIGVNVSAVSNDVVNNLSLLNKYNFQNGVQGLAKMAAQAANMRISVSDISGFMDRAFEPDSAIEMAAALQRLGVTQSDLLDPLRLMDLAQNDPTELMNQMSQMSEKFVRMKEDGSFEILPGAKRQLMEVEKSMGLASGTLSKMALASSELDKKMKSIQFPEIANEEQRKFIANMAEMNKAGTGFVVRYTDEGGKPMEKLTTELSQTDIDYLIKEQGKQPKTMEDIAKSQLTLQEKIYGVVSSIKDRTGRAIGSQKGTETMLGGVRKVTESVGELSSVDALSAKNLRNLADTQLNFVISGFKKLANGDEMGMLNDLSKAGLKLKETLDLAGQQMLKTEGLSGMLNYLTEQLKGAGVIKPTNIEPVTTPTNTTIPVKDFILKPLEQDKIVIGNTNLDGNKNKTPNETKTSNEVTLTLNINADPKLNKDEIMSVLNRTEILQELNKNLKSVNTNYNLT